MNFSVDDGATSELTFLSGLIKSSTRADTQSGPNDDTATASFHPSSPVIGCRSTAPTNWNGFQYDAPKWRAVPGVFGEPRDRGSPVLTPSPWTWTSSWLNIRLSENILVISNLFQTFGFWYSLDSVAEKEEGKKKKKQRSLPGIRRHFCG